MSIRTALDIVNGVSEIQARARLYNKAFATSPKPGKKQKRPGLLYSDCESGEWVTGTWCIGACYRNPSRMPDGSPFYGGYPHGYLDRVHSMFPDARRVLHAFSGGLTINAAQDAAAAPLLSRERCSYVDQYKAIRCPTCGCRACWAKWQHIELVDSKGHKDGRYPTWMGNVLTMPEDWEGRFDLVLADPPYSAADAVKYDCPAPNRAKIMRSLARVTATAGNLVWLDQVWPMHQAHENKKTGAPAQWKTWGHVGLVRSTNHRMRLVSFFSRQPRTEE